MRFAVASLALIAVVASACMLLFALSNNESAEVVIGQSKFTYGGINGLNPDSNTLDTPSSVFTFGSKMVIADANNNRVLIYNNIPTDNNASADVVVGQVDMTSTLANQGGSATANSLDSPYSAYATGTKLFIADRDNNRVLIYDPIPTANNATASVVVGQSDMTTSTAGTSTSSLNLPYGVSSDGTKLFIADRSNSRVLIFNTMPAANGATASVVVGQPDMTSAVANNGGLGANTLATPRFVWSDGTKLYIADTNNHRVLIFNSVPVADDASADTVIGQPDMISNSINQGGGVAANTLQYPNFVYTDGATKLFIGDTYNHRVLIFNSVPAVDDASADNVVGQWDLVSGAGASGANRLIYPVGVYCDGTKLYIADSGNHRAFIFNTVPAVAGISADYAVGQTNLTNHAANQGSEVTADNLYGPYSAFATGSKLFIADRTNNRVLIYNGIPTTNGAAADVVVGQADMTSNTANQGVAVAANTLQNPRFAYSDGTKLYIADTNNNRVLIYNSVPVANDASADVVVGQPNMGTNGANQGGLGVASMYIPMSVDTDASGKLYVADTYNHRVLIYNSVPVVDGASANVVVGQADMTSNTANQGVAAAANTLYYPNSVFSDGIKLFIADYNNHRALIFNSIPTADNTSADVVVGQVNMTTVTANQGGSVSANTLYYPTSVFIDSSGKLYVSDSNNHRALIYNSIPAANNASADLVLGQADMTSGSANQAGLPDDNTLDTPNTFNYDGSKYYISDYSNNRVLIYGGLPPYSESGHVIYY